MAGGLSSGAETHDQVQLYVNWNHKAHFPGVSYRLAEGRNWYHLRPAAVSEQHRGIVNRRRLPPVLFLNLSCSILQAAHPSVCRQIFLGNFIS